MKISYSKSFIKQSKKLPPTIKTRLVERVRLFNKNSLDPRLRNHKLKGEYKEYGSIDITGDYRALYLMRGEEIVFDHIGTHSQLYG